MGELEVPSNALYGANTRRAQLNFPISQLRFGRSLIKSLGLIKQSAAETNLELNLIDEKIAQSIISSSQEIIDGKQQITVPRIIAVTKTFSPNKITPLLEIGHLHFGENKIQEAENKWLDIKNRYKQVQLHMIGNLQSNKA